LQAIAKYFLLVVLVDLVVWACLSIFPSVTMLVKTGSEEKLQIVFLACDVGA
jgi:hypothetical protein